MRSLEPLAAPPEGCLRIVMLGDIVGKPGMRAVCDSVSWLKVEAKVDAIVANAENAADGSGLRCKDFQRLIDSGVHAVTLGDHAFRKREIIEFLESQTNIVRPANLPENAPGHGCAIVPIGETRLGVLSVQGRVFMKPVDCPFHAIDRQLEALDPSITIRLVDFHAEATSDMQLMGRYLAGRVSAVLGTHTHVATADEAILSGETGFQCDVGMSGPFESILGRKIDAVMTATLNGVPMPFQVATGDVRVNGTWFDVDSQSGRCKAIGRLEMHEAMIKQYNARQDVDRRNL